MHLTQQRASCRARGAGHRASLGTLIALMLACACWGGQVTPAERQDSESSDTLGQHGNEVLPPEANSTLAPVFGPHKLAIYWGQDTTGSEPNLRQICSTSQYDVIILSFVNVFGRNNSNNANNLPGSNFADHCETPLSSASNTVMMCPDFAPAITTCQAQNKRVLISMGGAQGSYGLADDADAAQLAQQMWQMYLGGQGSVRPFGSAILDGIDLDIEKADNSNSRTFYSTLVTTLRELMNADPTKRYALTAAPQCPYPDAYLGPGAGLALSNVPLAFDAMLVQFYNNPDCSPASTTTFEPAYQSWSALATQSNFRIFVGLPASTGAVTQASYFVPTAQLPGLLGTVDTMPSFGGVMLWDASNDALAGGNYSLFIQGMLQKLP